MSNPTSRALFFSSKRLVTLLLTITIFFGQFPVAIHPVFANHNSPGLATRDKKALRAADSVTRNYAAAAYGKLPLSFEANQGQFDSRVKFASRGSGYSLSLAQTEAGFKVHRGQTDLDLRMRWMGATPHVRVEGVDPLPGKSNYLIGNDQSKWQTGIANYAKVRYREIYRGIDMIFYGNQRQFEYDFGVKPGADTSAIKIEFDGVESLKIDRNGDLVLGTSRGELRQRKPVLYQEVNETKRMIAGRYVIRGKNLVGFEVAPYN